MLVGLGLNERVLTEPQLLETMAVTKKTAVVSDNQKVSVSQDVQPRTRDVTDKQKHVRPPGHPALKKNKKSPTVWSVAKYCTCHQQLGRCTRLYKPGHCARHMNGPYMQHEVTNGRTLYVTSGYQWSGPYTQHDVTNGRHPICNMRLSMVGPYM